MTLDRTDLCAVYQLVNASNEVRIESLGFVDRFWDKGVATAALKKQCKGLQASLQVKKNEFVEMFDKELRCVGSRAAILVLSIRKCKIGSKVLS